MRERDNAQHLEKHRVEGSVESKRVGPPPRRKASLGGVSVFSSEGGAAVASSQHGVGQSATKSDVIPHVVAAPGSSSVAADAERGIHAAITIPVLSSVRAGYVGLLGLVVCWCADSFLFPLDSAAVDSSSGRNAWALGFLVLAFLAVIPLCATLMRAVRIELRNRLVTPNLCLALAVVGVVLHGLYSAVFEAGVFVKSELVSLPLLVVCGAAVIRSSLVAALRLVRNRVRLQDELGVPARKVVAADGAVVRYVVVEADDCGEHDQVEVRSGEVVPVTGVVVDGPVDVRDPISGGVTRREHGMVIEHGQIVCGTDAKVLLTVLADDDLSPWSYFRAVSTAGMKAGSPIDASFYWGSVAAVVALLLLAVVSIVVGDQGGLPYGVGYLALLVVPLPFFLHLATSLRRLSVAGLCPLGVIIADEDALERVREAKAVAVDYPIPPRQVLPVVADLTMLDDRIERAALMGMLQLIFSRSRDTSFSSFQGVLSYLEQTERSTISQKIDDYVVEKGRGIAARVGGTNVCAGTEEFLVSRGVLLSPNDLAVSDEQNEVVYAAVDGTAVVRFELRKRVLFEGSDLQKTLASRGYRSWMMSSDSQSALDDFGKRAGFELANILGDLSGEAYRTNLLQLEPTLFYADPKHRCLDAALVTVSLFSRRLWDATRTDITLFGDEVHLLSVLLREARALKVRRIVSIVASGGVAATLLTLLSIGTLSVHLLPLAVAVTVLGGTFVLCSSTAKA